MILIDNAGRLQAVNRVYASGDATKNCIDRKTIDIQNLRNTGPGPLTAPADHSPSGYKPEKLNSWGSDIIASRAIGVVLQKIRHV